VTIIPAGYAQANWIMGGTGLPQGAQVTLGFSIGGYAGDAADLADLCIDEWVARIKPITPASITLSSVLVKFGPDATGPSVDVSAGEVGSGGGTATAPNTAWLVHKVTALGGRAGRGRMYWPGVQESEVDSAGQLSTAFRNGAQTNMTAMLGAFTLLNAVPVVLHGEASPITTPTVITVLRVDGTAATQRRRLRG
jgi:hypothetical protein